MNKESVGKLFKGNFGIYECVAYSDRPSVVMKNTITNESICVSIDSNYAKTFELIEEEKKIPEKSILDVDSDANGSYDTVIINGAEYQISRVERYMLGKINEIIDYINGGTND